MNYENIDQIFSANERIQDLFVNTLREISDGELQALPEDEKWSIKQIVEHVSIVEEGMSKICRKLLSEARENGLAGSGEIQISGVFQDYAENVDGIKLQAPERVWPTGQQSIEDSQKKIAEAQNMLENLRPLFSNVDSTTLKFPHPYFGPLSAQEWLVLSGEHMRRHTRQIEKLLEKIRQ
jgi:hypothetical protein